MGVSPNSVERHRRFLDKLGLRLTLLSNPRKTTTAVHGHLFGVDEAQILPDGRVDELHIYGQILSAEDVNILCQSETANGPGIPHTPFDTRART